MRSKLFLTLVTILLLAFLTPLSSMPFVAANPTITLTVTTNLTTYQPGSLIMIIGTLSEDNSPISSVTVGIQVTDPSGTIILLTTGWTLGDGTYSRLFMLPYSAPTGTYTVYVAYEDARAQTTFQVEALSSPAITLTPNAGLPDTPVNVQGGGFNATDQTCRITFDADYVGSCSLIPNLGGTQEVTGTFNARGLPVGLYTVTVEGYAAGGTPVDSATAHFTVIAPSSYGVTFYTSPSTIGNIVVAGHGTFSNGEAAGLALGNYTVTANPSSGYTFESWATVGNVTVTGTSTATMNVTGDGVVTAVFQTRSPSCPLGYDTETFTNPITISNQTTWSCVDYTFFSNVTITPTGTLNITSSTINSAIATINNTGTLRVDGSTVGWPINIVTSSNFETENSTLYSLTILSTATVTISQSRISEMLVYPEGNVRIVGFKPVLLTGDYDFAAWDMAAPHITVHSGSVVTDVSVSLAPGASATILQSEIGTVHTSGPVIITGSQFLSLYLTAGTASITDSTITYLYVSGSSTCAVTSSQVFILYLTGSTSDVVTVTGFNQTHNDGGNYNFNQWGFSQLHVTTSASTIFDIALSAGTVHVTDSTLREVEVDGTEHATILRSHVYDLSVGFRSGAGTSGGAVNATDSNIACGITIVDGGVVGLLNVTENIEIVSSCGAVNEIVGGTGVLDKSWYTFANVYDATTRQPISGVSLTIRDNLGHSQAATVNGAAPFTTQEYRKLASGTIEYVPYTFTFSKAGYNPTVVILQHFSNPVLNIYLQQATTATTTLTTTVSSTTKVTGTNSTATVTVSQTATGTSTIQTPSPLSMVIGSPHIAVKPGDTVSFTITITSLQPDTVTLILNVSPPGWAYAFTPTSGLASPNLVSTLTITTSSQSAPGAYSFTVTAFGDKGEETRGNLIVELASASTQTTQIVTSTVSPPKCIIATAAYGSEMAPDVVYMRYVRDGLIGSTSIGRPIVQGWNAFYYSWSPPIAQTISTTPILQALFRILLQPLIVIIRMAAMIFTAFAWAPSFASVVAFLVAAIVSVLDYIVTPACLIILAVRRGRPLR